jgi:hypothetical protein
MQLGLDSQYSRLGQLGGRPRSVGIHRRPPAIPIPPCELAAPFAMWTAFPPSDYYGGSAPPPRHRLTTSLSLDRTARLAAGSVAAVPMFTVNRLTGWAPSCAPTASPRVRRRLSSRPPRQTKLLADGVASHQCHGGRALLPGPDPPGFEPVRVLRGFNHWFTCVTPLCLACRTRAIWRYWPVAALSGLLPPDPASPGSGCPPLHRTAATARRWGPHPTRFNGGLMAHGLILERAREPRPVTRPRHRADHNAVAPTAHPRRLARRRASREVARDQPAARAN